MKQILEMKFIYLDDLPPWIIAFVGRLATPFFAIIYGDSGNGKTNLVFKLLKVLLSHGKVLYLSLEEGHGPTFQMSVERHLSDLSPEQSANLVIANNEMDYETLCATLRKKKSARFIIVDSLQYLRITEDQYFALRKEFEKKKKSFLFISHAESKKPKGAVGKAVEFNACIKIFVDRFIANVVSRFGGNEPHVIWEEGAKRKWGKKYRTAVGQPIRKETKDRRQKTKETDSPHSSTPIPDDDSN